MKLIHAVNLLLAPDRLQKINHRTYRGMKAGRITPCAPLLDGITLAGTK